MPWAACLARLLTVFFLNARTPRKCSSALTATPQEVKPVPDWHRPFPARYAVIRLVPARKDWNDVLRQQGDIPNRKFIAETITLRELPTAQPVPMLRMADVELTSVEWLWFPYIPFGKLTIIQGNPGEGKTYFAMRLAAACTNRKPLPGMETLEPFNIIYQTAEDGLGDTVKPRLIEADADLERVLVIDDRDTPLTLADERIARAIRENSAKAGYHRPGTGVFWEQMWT